MRTTSAPAAMPGRDGDPADVAAHHLQHHRPPMARRRRLQAVGRIDADFHRAQEADGVVGLGQVVVDRLRYADERDPALLGEAGEKTRAAVAADADQGVEVERVEALDRLVRPVLHGAVRHRILERIALVDRLQHRAALAQELAVHVLHRQVAMAYRPFQQPGGAGDDADHGEPIFPNRVIGDGANGGVQAGAVAARGQHADAVVLQPELAHTPACLPVPAPARIARLARGRKAGGSGESAAPVHSDGTSPRCVAAVNPPLREGHAIATSVREPVMGVPCRVVYSETEDDAVAGRGAARAGAAHPCAGAARGHRPSARAPLSGRAANGDVRTGLLLGRRAQVLEPARRLDDGGRAMPAGSRPIRPTRRSVPAAPATPRRCWSSSILGG